MFAIVSHSYQSYHLFCVSISMLDSICLCLPSIHPHWSPFYPFYSFVLFSNLTEEGKPSTIQPPFQTYNWSVIHSSNSLPLYSQRIDVDWQLMGQCIWFQDFPKKKDKDNHKGSSSREKISSFQQTLSGFLSHCKLSSQFLNQYDFSEAKVIRRSRWWWEIDELLWASK